MLSYAENINECKTDIYYGNGVWNEPEDAEDSRKELEKRILDREIIKGDPLLKAKYGKVKLAYNSSFGKLWDVLEVYYQLKKAGQLNDVGFYSTIFALTGFNPITTIGTIATHKLSEHLIVAEEEANVEVMWEKYYFESFRFSHRVLLVSHSQGNLFANRVYDTIKPIGYKEYFANVQVASPAKKVNATKRSHVTLWGDPVINPIPGSMHANASGSPGHAFVEAYLNQNDPYEKIVSRIKAELKKLDVELSQWNKVEEFDNNTCNQKVTVKHSFDPAVDMPFKVYPFNLSKRLYRVKNADGVYKWVMATCGRKNILDTWGGKKDNECWMIDNAPKEKISNSNNTDPDNNNSDSGNDNTGGGTDNNNSDSGDDNNNSGNNSGGGDTGGNSSTFDYKAQCSDIDFSDPIPSELEDSINDILNSNKNNPLKSIICPLINTAVQAYNLSNGGGLPGGGVSIP